MKKPSFFSRITGTAPEYDDEYQEEAPTRVPFRGDHEERRAHITPKQQEWSNAEDAGGELAVDVYQTPESIVIKAFIAGVQPNSVDISLTREMVTISGSRQDEKEVDDDGYFQRELYWGSFSRTILLPEEVDVDMAEASEKHGILIIRLPKINKKREMKLKVRTR
jgi:HSP20 family protein